MKQPHPLLVMCDRVNHPVVPQKCTTCRFFLSDIPDDDEFGCCRLTPSPTRTTNVDWCGSWQPSYEAESAARLAKSAAGPGLAFDLTRRVLSEGRPR